MENNKKKSEIELLTESEGDRMLAAISGVIPPIYSEQQAKQIFENIQNNAANDQSQG